MTTTVISPNMNLPVPVVGVEIGPNWANDLNACMSAIDSHDHASGQGVQITPDGLNINADLPAGSNNITTVRSIRFAAQLAPIAAATDLGCIYESGVDLYYNDGSGNQVRITQGGSVTGAAGTITGLPSGTASASYAASTFTFQSATNTPANVNVGPLTIGRNTASPKTVTLAPNAAQAANYNLTFPSAAPQANQVPITDGSGNLSWGWGLMPIGSVIATFPSLSGAYTTAATTTADAYGFVLCAGQVISDASSPMNGATVYNINNSRFLRGGATSGTTGGADTATLSTANLASHTHTFTSSTTVAAQNHTHNMQHLHQWGYGTTSLYTIGSGSVSAANTFFTTSPPASRYLGNQGAAGGGISVSAAPAGFSEMYTSGVLSSPSGSGLTAVTDVESSDTTVSGTTAGAGSGTAFSILPSYITAVYLMRIK